MRDLITGGAGFIGSHLADRLVQRGREVVLLDDLSTGRVENVEHLIRAGTAELVEGSTSDEALVYELMADSERCFHLASAVGVALICERPLESLLRNVRGADVVSWAAARSGVRLIFASSSEVYGKNSNGALREESDRLLGPPQRSRWGYATAKAFGEMLAYGYQRERGAETVVVRFFNTVGPRQTGAYGMVLPRFCRQALLGEELTVYGDGLQSRCFSHVHDTVDAVARLGEEDRALGGVYNVGAEREITILELAERVVERAESTSPIRFVPYEEAYEDGFEELGRRKPDTSALRELTAWAPTRSIETMIDDVLAYQRAELRRAVRPAASVAPLAA